MRFPKYLLAVPCILIVAGAIAQSGSSNANNAELKKSIQAIGGLFKKKNKDSVAATQTSAGTQTVNSAQSSKTNSSAIQLKGGDVTANVKYLNVDQLTPFNKGSAVVIKGSSYATIDTAGNFIVPFNTYNVITANYGVLANTVLINGLFKFRTLNQQDWGFMDAKGKVIARGVLTDVTENKRLLQLNTSGNWTYTTPDGQKYATKDFLYNINQGIGILRVTTDNGNKALWGYKKLTGETVTAPVFDEAYGFSEGLAVVGKKNEFGEMKYGYINLQGKLVIPFSFSIKPSDFSGGFAKVQPKDKTEFEYAFINRVGAVVFKQTLADVTKYGAFDHFTNFGLAINFKYVMDTTFKMITKKDFFAAFGITTDAWFVNEQSSIENQTRPKLLFSIRGVISPFTQMPIVGFINLVTRKVVMPIFDLHDQNSIYFDPVSQLAYAKVCLGKDARGSLIYREGYINEDGRFTMVKGEGSKW